MSVWTTPLGIAGIVFIVIGIIMAIVGIVLLVLDKDVEKPWYIWVLLAGGIVMGIIGGIMLAVAYSREEPKLMASMYCATPTTMTQQQQKPVCAAVPMQNFAACPNTNRNACISTKGTPVKPIYSNVVTPVKPIYTTVPIQQQEPALFTPAPMIQNQTFIPTEPPINPMGAPTRKIDNSFLELPPQDVIAPQKQTLVQLPNGQQAIYHHDSNIYTTNGAIIPADMFDPRTGREY